jgi:hypothetical protein
MANSRDSDDLTRISCSSHLGRYGRNRNIDTIASTADSQILMFDIFTSLHRLTTAAVVAIAKLFSVEIDGVDYALEYNCEVDEDDGKEYENVMLWPQDLMFHEHWDSGSYSS